MRLKNKFWFSFVVALWYCSETLAHQSHTQQMMDQFKNALLPMFGFKEKPQIHGKVEVPDTLRNFYNMQNEFEYDTVSLPLPGMYTGGANTVRSFRHVESPIDDRFQHPNKFRLKFNISSIPSSEKVTAAVLQLTREPLSPAKNRYQRILIEDIVQRGIKNGDGPHLVVLDTMLIDTRENTTLTLNILPAVQRWLKNPKKNFGLLVSVFTSKERKIHKEPHVRLKRNAASNWAQTQPLLLAFADDGKYKPRTGKDLLSTRRKRAPRRSHRKNERDPCKRRQMYVNFRDVGWNDWIVAPLGYDAFYCAGDCEYPMADHLNTTNHAIVQSLMNSVRPSDVPKPCCVPTSLTSMSMLYVDSMGGVILKNYKEMVVTGCGCR